MFNSIKVWSGQLVTRKELAITIGVLLVLQKLL